MDEITKYVLLELSKRHPLSSIILTHQFLDGSDGKSCGSVPSEWDGSTLKITGTWWNEYKI